MRALFVAVAAAGLLAFAGASPGKPFTETLDGVKAEIDAQVAALQAAADPADARTLKFLLKAQAYLERDGTSVLKDLKTTLQTAKLLERKVPADYPGRDALLAALGGALDGFDALVSAATSEHAALVAGLDDPVLGDRLQALLDQAIAALDAAGVAPDTASRIRYLSLAWKKTLSVDAFLAKVLGRGGMGALVGGDIFSSPSDGTFGGAYWVAGGGPPLQYWVEGHEVTPAGTYYMSLDFYGADLRTFASAYTFSVAGGSFSAIYSFSDPGGNFLWSRSASAGSLTALEYDPAAGFIRGHFEFEFYDSDLGATVLVRNGTFAAYDRRLKAP